MSEAASSWRNGFERMPERPVTPQIGQDQLKFCSPLRERRNPTLTRTRKAVQQQERLTSSVNLKIQFLAVERFNATGRTCRHFVVPPCRKLWGKKKTARAFARAVRHLF